jgi:DNA-binding MarR family transcriptional regulator
MTASQPRVQGTEEIAELLHDRFARFARLLRNIDMSDSMTQERLSAMSAINERGPISVTALADLEMVIQATMSRMVSSLVDDGLARRIDDKTDGRGVLVVATAKGRRTFKRAYSTRLQRLSGALNTLSREQLAAMQALASALERLTSELDR